MVSRELSLPRLTLDEFTRAAHFNPTNQIEHAILANQSERNQASGGLVFARFLVLGAGCMLLCSSPDWSIVFFGLTAILLMLV